MADKNTKKAKKQKVASDKRNTNLKWFSVGSAVLLIAIVLVFNILFDSILGKYLNFDLSSTGQNSISSVTVDYINTLPADANIRIVGLFDKPSSIKDTPYEYIIPLLDDYAAKSAGRITVDYINPSSYPTILTELDPNGMYDLKADSFVIAYNGMTISVNPYDCFTYDPTMLSNYGYYLPTANIVENTFTNAIVNLTRGFLYKAYFVTTSQTYSHQQFSNILSAIGCESEDLSATDDFSVPADCDLLVISGLNTDITERMAQRIIDYINAGGKVIVAVDFTNNNSSEQFLNLNVVLHEMNLNIDYKVLVENDTNYQLGAGSASACLSYNATIESQFTSYGNSTVLKVANCRPVRSFDNPYSYISVAPILTTSSQASASELKANGSIDVYANQGTYNVAYYSTFTGMNNPPEMYVFGSMSFTSDEYISSYGYGDDNIVFIRNIVRSMLKAEDSVYVEAKSLSDYSLDSTKVTNQNATKLMVVLMVIIPAGLVITGVIVYSRRKNL